MNARLDNRHDSIIAEYYKEHRGHVTELRCLTCNVIVAAWVNEPIARVQQAIHQTWQRHSTPAEVDWQI